MSAPPPLTKPSSSARAVPILDVHDVTVAYHQRPVLWDVDLTIDEPKLVGIIGPNGAGKSTLVKAILGLVPLAGGYVHLFGKEPAAVRRRIGYVPQRESVDWDFPVSVLDVVLMGTYGRLGWFRRPKATDRAWARECLDQVGMADFANRQIGQLSGGQQQRTFLARALAQKAEIYFMDEPMAGVDAATERIVFALLRQLRDEGKTLLVVHHDLRTVPEYFEYVAMMNMRLTAAGPTETTFTPQNLQKTYGGRLDVLDAAAEAVRKQQKSE
ncbi:MAG: metal ABC transporter ATP-binding protein [Planctomycetaceae bacterium]|nr:metal ABC transporter ATP-binding protein [Planctomycetaceae bacterium]